jgi:hypothetical protein
MAPTQTLRYAELIKRFLASDLPANEFEGQFLDMWRRERDSGPRELSESAGAAVDRLFTAVDAFVPEPDSPGPYEIDELQLRREAQEVLSILEDPAT